MNNKAILDNHLFVFALFILTSAINIISSVYFMPIMFAGVLLIALIRNLDNKYFYSTIWILIAFLILESNQGLKSFSLIIFSLFVYVYLQNYIKNVFSSKEISKIIYIIILYFSIAIYYILFGQITYSLILFLLLNLAIDSIIVGLLI